MILLYSCNHQVKFDIHEAFRGGIHYVWCSEHYDSRTATGLSSRLGFTSNPAQILRHMMEVAYPDPDGHAKIILEQREKLVSRSFEWWDRGEISEDQYDEIVAMTARTDVGAWRPLLYVIPVTAVLGPRIKSVPVADRSSVGGEYVIEDLSSTEFHVVRPDLVEAYA